MVWTISYTVWNIFRQLGPTLATVSPPKLFPTSSLLAEVQSEKQMALRLYQHCSALAKTLVCYQHCFHQKSKNTAPHKLL